MYDPQFNTAELSVMSAFQNILHIALLKLIVNETNRNAQQEISESVSPFTFHSRIGKCEYVTVAETYVVLMHAFQNLMAIKKFSMKTCLDLDYNHTQKNNSVPLGLGCGLC